MKLHPTLGEISDDMAAKLAEEGDTSAVPIAPGAPAELVAEDEPEAQTPAEPDAVPSANAAVEGAEAESDGA